jgi:hypothetical protein
MPRWIVVSCGEELRLVVAIRVEQDPRCLMTISRNGKAGTRMITATHRLLIAVLLLSGCFAAGCSQDPPPVSTQGGLKLEPLPITPMNELEPKQLPVKGKKK